VSVFEAHTEIIRKGKASQPNEFGKLVKIQEAENQIVTHFEVFAERPEDSTLLLPDPGTPTEIGTNPARSGCRCGILFVRERESGARTRGTVDVGAEQENKKF
jgi:IS5 family transposase